MLQNKDIKNLSELTLTFVDKHNRTDFFSKYIEILKIGKSHGIFSCVKTKGYSALLILKVLIVIPFLGQKTVHSLVNSPWNKYSGFGKDVYYRLKNNPKINWRGLLFSVVQRLIITLNNRIDSTDSNDKQAAFIFDDTTITKTGYKIEGTSRVWSHVINKHILGYQLLVMGYYNGIIFLPINFSIHREKGNNKNKPYNLKPKELRKQLSKKRDTKSPGAARKKELDQNKIKSSIKMIKQALRRGIKATYVLTDSWFTCWEMVKTALENNLIYIGMFSKVKTLFEYRNCKLNYKTIRKLNRKKVKRNRKYKLYYIRTFVMWKGHDVVLYHTRKGKRGKWKILLSTDTSSNFNSTLEIYQIRWSIEVFFKESKQMLSLGKSQSNDFDGQIADTTISMIQYLFLALQNQIDSYETLGKLFVNTKAEMLDIKLHERLLNLLIEILKIIETLFENSDSDIIMTKLLNNDKAYEQLKLLLNAPFGYQERAA
jgi:hypothetical protein